MTAESRGEVESKLKDLEDKSGIQFVVVTVKSLEGSDIDSYANELFRFWKLGQAQKNNGVLLLVAPSEHKVRIEVGYGLEGTLTDALSSVIISSAIIPRFKTGDFSGGIERGVDGVVSVLSGDTTDWQPKVDVRQEDTSAGFDELFPILFFLLFVFICWYLVRNANGGPPGGTTRRGARPDFRALWRVELGWRRRIWRRRFRRWLLRWWRIVGRWWGVGELVMQLSQEDHAAISNAIRDAERRTNGQIVCVLAHASSEYVHVPILWASALALLAPWPLINFTEWSVQRIFLLQIVTFIVAAFAFSWMPLRLALVPHVVRRERAHRAALEQFVVRGISRTKNRTGVLIFVSLAEHYARIIADEGIAQKVQSSEWQAAIDALTNHMSAGRIAQGFTAAVERCGAVLAAHAPSDGSPNELPDRLYII